MTSMWRYLVASLIGLIMLPCAALAQGQAVTNYCYNGSYWGACLTSGGVKQSGTATTTTTGTTSLIAAVTNSRIYAFAFACYNSGSTSSVISFQDGSGGTTLFQTIVPAGGGSNLSGNVPLFWTTAGNALYFAAGSASTTIGCSVAGFSGN
jgi:hypothetical protein